MTLRLFMPPRQRATRVITPASPLIAFDAADISPELLKPPR